MDTRLTIAALVGLRFPAVGCGHLRRWLARMVGGHRSAGGLDMAIVKLARSALRAANHHLVLGTVAPAEPTEPVHVLSFWFGRPPGPRFELVDAMWLPTRIPCWGGHWAGQVLDVDGVIERHFGALHRRAAAGELDDWCESPDGRLAIIIVLDQISRNIHRGTAEAFAQDGKVLPIVERALSAGDDRRYNPLARTLLYLPLMHHEDVAMLDRCIGLYEAAYAEARGLPKTVLKVELASGRRHREIVARFGRFPHRNEALGRKSTPEEERFLREESFSSF